MPPTIHSTEEKEKLSSYKKERGIRGSFWLALPIGVVMGLSVGFPGIAVGELNKIGGNGGKPHMLQCPPRQHAVGIAARHDGRVLIQLNLRCVSVNPSNGNWLGSPKWQGYSPTDRLQGKRGLTSRSVSCPENEFIEPSLLGRTGKVGFAKVVSGLEWRCLRFSRIDATQGKSRKTRRNGQFGVGFIFNGPQQQSRDGTVTDSALHALHLKYGMALDSVRIQALHMPWTGSSKTNQRAPTRSTRSRKRSSTAATQPDLTVRLTSTLWRYEGSTRRSGRSFRKVPEAFCASGMIPRDGGRSATKNFTLSDIRYQVKNNGSASTNRNFNVQTTLGTQVRASTVPSLRPGQRRNLRISRSPRVRRCVTNKGVLGGCHECAGQSNYQDPRLEIIVDTANVIAESNENNNKLSR